MLFDSGNGTLFIAFKIKPLKNSADGYHGNFVHSALDFIFYQRGVVYNSVSETLVG